MRESLTHACNSNRAINLIKQGKMKNLLLRLRLKARLRETVLTIDDSACCSRRRKLLTTKEPVDDGLRSTMGREGCLLAGHSPLFLLIFTCFGRLFS
jgi:hypothetical protein